MSEISVPMLDFSAGHLTSVFNEGVDALFAAKASDITIQSDDFVWAYINRKHTQVSNLRLDDSQVTAIVRHISNGDQVFSQIGSGQGVDAEVDIRPYIVPGMGRFDPDYSVRCRVNITGCRVGNTPNGYSITLRTIPGLPPPFESLNLPEEIARNFFPKQGLVALCGITGSGKSTTMAAAIGWMLKQADNPVKIGTYEDPIEFIFPRMPMVQGGPGKSAARMPEVSQAQIGSHLKEFAFAAPNALRRKFDVLMMGEMRDKESVSTGLLLAATGHATYTTLHCETPAEAVARIVSEFPYEAQPGIANKLLDNLRLIVAQKIERNLAGKGVAFRSWCVFDQAFKAHLSTQPHPQWSRMIVARMQQTNATFAQQAIEPFIRGEISQQAFANVAGFNSDEAEQFIEAYRSNHAE